MNQHIFRSLLLCVCLGGIVMGQDATPPVKSADADIVPATITGTRRVLIVCGLSGDAEHRKQFGESLQTLHAGLIKYHGVAADHITVLFGEPATDKDPASVKGSQIATRDSIIAAATALCSQSQSDDSAWIFVIGHTHHDGRQSWLNIKDADLNQTEFGRLFADLNCREQVFFLTTPLSGFFIKPLAHTNRVVMTATEADQEVNETLFPQKLIRGLGSPPPFADFDIDKDGQASLFDLYLWTTRETAQEYATGELLATEHALLDDTGDGRGTEVQINYLSEELGGRRRPSTANPPLPKGDGQLARQIPLPRNNAPIPLPGPESPEPPPLPEIAP